MNTPDEYSFMKYLASKKRIDDRSLNQHVWRRLVNSLSPSKEREPLRVLEVGAGIGTMLERMIDWGLLHYASYTALDADPVLLSHGHKRLSSWAPQYGFKVEKSPSGMLTISAPGHFVKIEFLSATLADFLTENRHQVHFDLIVAHAFLDLINLPAALPALLGLLSTNGIFYFTINYDGLTHFEPTIDPFLDELILAQYNRSMDERIIDGMPSGDCRTGRHLFSLLADLQANILAAGASDWVCHPMNCQYEPDEAYFLHYILHTLHTALLGNEEIDPDELTTWIDQRHNQIECGKLSYIAHQLDMVGCVQ